MGMGKHYTDGQRAAFAARLAALMERHGLAPADLIRRIKQQSGVVVKQFDLSRAEWQQAFLIVGSDRAV